MGRRSGLAVGLVLLAAACTSTSTPAPAPSPTAPLAGSVDPAEPIGLRVAVVLPAPGQAPLTPAGTRIAAEGLAERHRSKVGEFRTVTPDAGAYVGDIAVLLAEQGYDLVCVVGRGAADVVVEIAPTFPATRFCGVPAPGRTDEEAVPSNALLVDLRLEEADYLAGVAAATAPRGPRATPSEGAPAPPPAGIVIGAPGASADRQRTAFGAGVAAVRGAQATPRVDVGVTDPEELRERVATQIGLGVPVVYVAAGIPDDVAIESAAALDGRLILLRDRARFEGGTPEVVIAWMRIDVSGAIDLAVTRAIDAWEGGLASVGTADGAIRPQAGAAEGSTTTFGRVREVADLLRDGSRTVPEP